MGLGSATLYAIVGILAVNVATGEGYAWLVLTNPIAGFISGSILWWLFVGLRDRRGFLFPVIAGGLAGSVGHFINWYLLLIGASVCNLISGGCTGTLGESPMNPLQALAGAALYGGISLVFIGWFTIPAGIIIGILLAYLQGKTNTP